jgi:hypothetical protein
MSDPFNPIVKIKRDDEKLSEKFKPEDEKFTKEIEKVKADNEKLPDKAKPEGEKITKEIEKVKADNEKPVKEKHEKIEKREFKENKLEFKENKNEIKEIKGDKEKDKEKEFKEHIKEHKFENKEAKFEKIEQREDLKQVIEQKGVKEVKEAEGPDLGDLGVSPVVDRAMLLRHAEALEAMGRGLRHFIEAGDRPDLSRGALHDEPDQQDEQRDEHRDDNQ